MHVCMLATKPPQTARAQIALLSSHTTLKNLISSSYPKDILKAMLETAHYLDLQGQVEKHLTK